MAVEGVDSDAGGERAPGLAQPKRMRGKEKQAQQRTGEREERNRVMFGQ